MTGRWRPAASTRERCVFSIGLEDAEDLISDVYVALESLGRP